MIITYEKFMDKLNKKIKSGEDFYLELLKTVIDNPSRYCGLFRLSNAKTKLIQNVTQSKEIKFGDFMEDIATDYINLLGYKNQEKGIGCDENGDRLNADQFFIKDNIMYLVEQKIRDDHDSTKKRGQFANFDKKVRLIKKQHPGMHLVAIMWFIDDGLVKNKNYYKQEMNNSNYSDTDLFLYYGGEFFESLNGGAEVWDEMVSYLERNRMENSQDIFTIPDFDSSDEILNALLNLPRIYWKKLLSNNTKYDLLRKELFSSGDNLEKARKKLGY
ncbi:MAG: hypothetical protein VB122_02470 [Erysipelotrichales bacterium]|nr:hypothetical protein [Erysipelotrichales bacterium]